MSSPRIENGDIIHASNKEVISISANSKNSLLFSNIGKISSITSGLGIPVAGSTTGYTTCQLDTNYSSNDRSGAVIITWTNTGVFSSAVARGTLTFNTPYSNAPKVIITPYDQLAITGAGTQLHYYVKTTTTGFGIFTNTDAATGQVEKFFYIVEE